MNYHGACLFQARLFALVGRVRGGAFRWISDHAQWPDARLTRAKSR